MVHVGLVGFIAESIDESSQRNGWNMRNLLFIWRRACLCSLDLKTCSTAKNLGNCCTNSLGIPKRVREKKRENAKGFMCLNGRRPAPGPQDLSIRCWKLEGKEFISKMCKVGIGQLWFYEHTYIIIYFTHDGSMGLVYSHTFGLNLW